jgi:hypothetical protein
MALQQITAKADSACGQKRRMTLKDDNSGEFDVIFKPTLRYESEDLMGTIHEIDQRSKIL